MVACDTTIRLQSPNVSPLVMKSLGYATANAQPLNRTELLTQVTQDKIDLLQDIMKLNLASWMLKPPLLWCLKGCMCVFFLRLTNNLPWMRKLTLFTCVACVLTFIATELTLLLQCVPPKNHWDIFAYNWRNCSNSFSTRTQIVNYLVVGLTNIMYVGHFYSAFFFFFPCLLGKSFFFFPLKTDILFPAPISSLL